MSTLITVDTFNPDNVILNPVATRTSKYKDINGNPIYPSSNSYNPNASFSAPYSPYSSSYTSNNAFQGQSRGQPAQGISYEIMEITYRDDNTNKPVRCEIVLPPVKCTGIYKKIKNNSVTYKMGIRIDTSNPTMATFLEKYERMMFNIASQYLQLTSRGAKVTDAAIQNVRKKIVDSLIYPTLPSGEIDSTKNPMLFTRLPFFGDKCGVRIIDAKSNSYPWDRFYGGGMEILGVPTIDINRIFKGQTDYLHVFLRRLIVSDVTDTQRQYEQEIIKLYLANDTVNDNSLADKLDRIRLNRDSQDSGGLSDKDGRQRDPEGEDVNIQIQPGLVPTNLGSYGPPGMGSVGGMGGMGGMMNNIPPSPAQSIAERFGKPSYGAPGGSGGSGGSGRGIGGQGGQNGSNFGMKTGMNPKLGGGYGGNVINNNSIGNVEYDPEQSYNVDVPSNDDEGNMLPPLHTSATKIGAPMSTNPPTHGFNNNVFNNFSKE